ncbi:MAG: hypothetical protein K6G00_05615 [Treponema sp.]|nr:hypothetical protein [Treponema sp.]
MTKNKFLGFSVIAVLAILAAVIFSGCESPRSASYGVPDVGYVQFVSSTNYRTVTAVFDDDVTIKAKVNSAEDRTIESDSNYAVTTGRHSVQVFNSKGTLLVSKDIFLSAQEIRIIYLP